VPSPGLSWTWLAAKSTCALDKAAAKSTYLVDLAASQVEVYPGLGRCQVNVHLDLVAYQVNVSIDRAEPKRSGYGRRTQVSLVLRQDLILLGLASEPRVKGSWRLDPKQMGSTTRSNSLVLLILLFLF